MERSTPFLARRWLTGRPRGGPPLRHAAWLGLILLVAACEAGVNQDLLTTPTPYPIRTPVASTTDPAATPSSALGTLATAAAALAAGQTAAAEAAYDQTIALDPAGVEAFLGRASLSVYLAQGDPRRYDHALADFNRVLAIDPPSHAARLGRAHLYLDRAVFRGDPADLERALMELDTLPDGGEAAALLRAEVLAALGDVEAARRLLPAATAPEADERFHNQTDRHLARATVALAARDWTKAAAAARDAIGTDPMSWKGHRLLAAAELAQGNDQAALAAADDLLDRWPEDGPGLYLRGAALLGLGRHAEADEALTVARARLAASSVYQARIEQARRAGPEASPAAGGVGERRLPQRRPATHAARLMRSS